MTTVSLKHKTIHPKFRLNGTFYSKVDLRALAYDLIKEGESFEQEIGDFLSDWLNDSPSIKVKTSGSTGVPKIIELQKENMVNSALATGLFFHLNESAKALLCLSAAYIAGKMMLVRALVLGLELDYVLPSSVPLQGISKTYDFAAMVPLQLENSLESIASVKKLIVGGTSISMELKNRVQQVSTEIFETYGMTETITHVAARKVNNLKSFGEKELLFEALPGVTFSTDDRGCLVINAPHLSNTAQVTNDLVKLKSETAFDWLGRFDNVINSGGIKLFPEQIEAKLTPLLNVPFFVAGLPDKDLGQQLILIVKGTLNISEFKQTLEEQSSLERFEIPKKIYSLPEFSETETGKIHRKETLKLLKS